MDRPSLYPVYPAGPKSGGTLSPTAPGCAAHACTSVVVKTFLGLKTKTETLAIMRPRPGQNELECTRVSRPWSRDHRTAVHILQTNVTDGKRIVRRCVLCMGLISTHKTSTTPNGDTLNPEKFRVQKFISSILSDVKKIRLIQR